MVSESDPSISRFDYGTCFVCVRVDRGERYLHNHSGSVRSDHGKSHLPKSRFNRGQPSGSVNNDHGESHLPISRFDYLYGCVRRDHGESHPPRLRFVLGQVSESIRSDHGESHGDLKASGMTHPPGSVRNDHNNSHLARSRFNGQHFGSISSDHSESHPPRLISQRSWGVRRDHGQRQPP